MFQQCVLQVVAYFVFDLKNKSKIKEGTIWNKNVACILTYCWNWIIMKWFKSIFR